MSVPAWISTRGDTDRDLLVAQLVAKQPDVLAAEDLYLQVLSGMSGIPADQNALAVDGSIKPDDRGTSPQDWGIVRPATSTVATYVDIYGSGGWGIRQAAFDSGVLWSRSEWVVNPKSMDDTPWTAELPIPSRG